MRPKRIYIDTSVIGGCFDIEFAKWSNQLFEEFQWGRNIAVVSELVIQELDQAPEKVRSKLDDIPDAFVEMYEITDEMTELAKGYLDQNIVTPKYRNDAIHIAIATIIEVDVLTSWNFKHIVNYNRIKQFNGVNLINGYKSIEIRSPREVVENAE